MQGYTYEVWDDSWCGFERPSWAMFKTSRCR